MHSANIRALEKACCLLLHAEASLCHTVNIRLSTLMRGVAAPEALNLTRFTGGGVRLTFRGAESVAGPR